MVIITLYPCSGFRNTHYQSVLREFSYSINVIENKNKPKYNIKLKHNEANNEYLMLRDCVYAAIKVKKTPHTIIKNSKTSKIYATVLFK